MNPIVSIIIPTYKPGALLNECLGSIAAQSYKYYELIIILNGCNEPYYSKINNWISEHNLSDNTQLAQTCTSGVSNARNIGIGMAKGEFICFIDDDDLVTQNYLDELVRNSDENNITISNVVSLNEEDSTYNLNYSVSRAFERLSQTGCNSLFKGRKLLNGPWMKLFPRKIIGDSRFNPKIHLGEDALFSFIISKKIKGLSFTSSDAKYVYRQRKRSSWSNKSVKQLLNDMFYLHYEYMSNYLSSPSKYNFLYFISRIIGVEVMFMSHILKSLIAKIKKTVS